jgi:hypothetical protein
MNKNDGMFNLVETSDISQNFQTIDIQTPITKQESNNGETALKVFSVSSEDVKQISSIEEPEKLNTINEPIFDTLVIYILMNRNEISLESDIKYVMYLIHIWPTVIARSS